MYNTGPSISNLFKLKPGLKDSDTPMYVHRDILRTNLEATKPFSC
jgi:hypothetical protein